MNSNQNPKKFIKDTVNEIVSLVEPTYGPNAQRVLLQDGRFIDDGATIVKHFIFEDRQKDAVMQGIREVALKTDSRVGDGTTGSLIILRALMDTDLDNIDKGFDELKAELWKRTIEPKDLEQVAYISFNDSRYSKLIADMVRRVGKNGYITVEESQSIETTSEVAGGMYIEHGFASPYFAVNQKKEIELNSPKVFITTQKLVSAKDMIPVLENSTGGSLLVIAPEIDGEALFLMLKNKLQGIVDSVAIKVPIEELDDLAAYTGSEVFAKEAGIKFSPNMFGTCKGVKVSKDISVIFGSVDISEYIKGIEDKNRLARLTDGIGIIRVGASTEKERNSVYYKVQDAVNATLLAQKSGVIKGAGQEIATIQTSSLALNKALLEPSRILGFKGEVYDPTEVILTAIESAVSIAKLLKSTKIIIYENNPITK